MPDNLLLIVFGILSTIGLLVGGIAIYLAMRSAKRTDGELMMVFWACVALIGLTFAGMCWAYFIIPILANRLF
jgi:heme/copper-type cytochrome/quinol oxidase subunit 3